MDKYNTKGNKSVRAIWTLEFWTAHRISATLLKPAGRRKKTCTAVLGSASNLKYCTFCISLLTRQDPRCLVLTCNQASLLISVAPKKNKNKTKACLCFHHSLPQKNSELVSYFLTQMEASRLETTSIQLPNQGPISGLCWSSVLVASVSTLLLPTIWSMQLDCREWLAGSMPVLMWPSTLSFNTLVSALTGEGSELVRVASCVALALI